MGREAVPVRKVLVSAVFPAVPLRTLESISRVPVAGMYWFQQRFRAVIERHRLGNAAETALESVVPGP